MISNRRDADVDIKKSAAETKKWLKKETRQKLSLNAEGEPEDRSDGMDRLENSDAVNAVFKHVAKVKNLACQCAEPNWERENTEEVEETRDFRLTFRCTKCQTTKELVLSVKELQDIESQFREGGQMG